jgi:hypothetical protein
MSRIVWLAVGLCGLSVGGCGSTSEDEPEDDVVVAVQPQAGDWDIVTTGWTDDDCNAAEALTSPDSVTFSDVSESSFSMTLYEGDLRIGDRVTCTHAGDDVYECEEFYHSLPFDGMDATVVMVGQPTVTLSSETAASGVGLLSVDCEGTACGMIPMQTPLTGFPCATTTNWTALPQ